MHSHAPSAGWFPIATAARGKGGRRAWSLEAYQLKIDAVMIMRDESAFTTGFSPATRQSWGCAWVVALVSAKEEEMLSASKHTDPGRIVCGIMIDATAKGVRDALMGLRGQLLFEFGCAGVQVL